MTTPISSSLPPLPTTQAKKAAPTLSKEEQRRLNDATSDFEAMFMQQLFKQMRRTVPEDPNGRMFAKSEGEKIFTEMLDSERAKGFSRGRTGLGLKEQIFKQAVGQQLAQANEMQDAANRAKKSENSLNAVTRSPIGMAGSQQGEGITPPVNAVPSHLPAAGLPTRVGPAGPSPGGES